MSDKKDVRLAIRISRELREAALEKSKHEDLTVSQVVRRFLRKWVEDDPPEPSEESEPDDIG